MAAGADSAFIRRAVELADLNAIKLALFQLTGDETVAALPVEAAMSADEKAMLIDRAAAWLVSNAGPADLPEPPEAQLRRMMDMVTGGTMGDLEFAARRDLTGFKQFPYMAEWTAARPAAADAFKVAVIGSGFGGISAAVQLSQLGIAYTVYERRPEPGGVWSINRYPDVRVDTISVTYEFLFERDHEWDEYFGRGPDVREYLGKVSRKYGVWDNSRFGHDLKQARFDESRKLWVLEFETPDGIVVEEANAIISCAGLFATPKVIDFAGKTDFEGRVIHTAQWTDDVDLAGKKVATIGNGSTGVQLLGTVARQAEHVTVFQRTPQWIMPRDKYGQPIEPEVKWLVRNLPGYWNWWRYSQTSSIFETHALMQTDPEWQAKGGLVSKGNDAIRADLTAYITAQTGGRPDLMAKLVPDYAPFSRRPIVDNGWYRALTRDNVELVTSPIKRLVPKGIETEDGAVHEIDVFITATGYDVVRYLWPAQYIGTGGVNLHEEWGAGDGPRAYVGMMHPRFPNLFTLYGPNSQPISGGPAQPVWFAIWAAFAAQCIVRVIESGHESIEVTQGAYDRYNRELDAESRKLIQMSKEGGVDRNYYVNAEQGRLQVNAPFYSPYFHQLCSDIRWEDMKLA